MPPPELLLLLLLAPLELELPELWTPELLLLLELVPLLELPPKPDELLLDPPELLELELPLLLLLLLDPLDPDEPLLPEDPEELLLGSSGFCPPLLPPLLFKSAGETVPPSSEGGGSCVVPPYGPPRGSPLAPHPIEAPSARAVKVTRTSKPRRI